MGRAKLVTATALEAYRDMRKEVEEATSLGEITPYRACRVIGQMIRLCDAMVFADNRIAVARLAMEDVSDVRNIERRCMAAYIHPVTFDLGPSGEAA